MAIATYARVGTATRSARGAHSLPARERAQAHDRDDDVKAPDKRDSEGRQEKDDDRKLGGAQEELERRGGRELSIFSLAPPVPKLDSARVALCASGQSEANHIQIESRMKRKAPGM